MTFQITTIHPGAGGGERPSVSAASYDLEPSLEQGRQVCALFASFLSGQPGQFRERIPFLNNMDLELDWAAQAGGAAFAAFFAEGSPVTIGVLLAGTDPEVDSAMREAMRESVLRPLFGELLPDSPLMDASERPLAMMVRFNDRPELLPAVDLLTAALASVYFRAVAMLAASGERAPRA